MPAVAAGFHRIEQLNAEPARKPIDQSRDENGSRDVASLAARARAALDSKDFAAALTGAEELLRSFPRERQGFILKARTLLAQGCADDALQTMNQALAAQQDDPKLLSLARNIALQRSGPHLATEYALRLSKIVPNDLKNEILLIDWHLRAGEPQMALRRVDALIKNHPLSSRGPMLKAAALLKLQRSAEAMDVIRAALPSHSEDVKFLSFARNTAFTLGLFAEAEDFGLTILKIAPGDQKNRVFLVQCCLATGAFANALGYADALVAEWPDCLPAVMLRAQSLLALHCVAECLEVLETAVRQNPDDRRLLHMARNIAFQNGRFDRAADWALRLTQLEADDDVNKAFLIHAYVAGGRFDAVADFFRMLGKTPGPGVLLKERHHFEQFNQLTKTAPALASAWQAALQNTVERAPSRPEGDDLGTTMIQYWSQGGLPADVQIVCDNWKSLFERERLGKVELFDRASAEVWIQDNAPEFNGQFSKAFHYAMESDIFRIAYASKRSCIYMDIDSWPLEHTASILSFAVRSRETMLYLRAHRATIVNGFFVSNPQCPFIRELVDQCLAIDLDSLPKDYLALEGSFGPSRYSKVFLDLLKSSVSASVSKVEEVPGCSVVDMGGYRVYFSHEAAVASVRPPFPLGYKATDDYWKFISLPD